MPSTTKAANTAASTSTPWPFSESSNTCAAPWKPDTIEAGQVGLLLDLADGVDRRAERITGSQIERDRHRGLLALVIDLQRADGRHQLGHRGYRNHRPGRRGRPVDARARRRVRWYRRRSTCPLRLVFRKTLLEPGRIGLDSSGRTPGSRSSRSTPCRSSRPAWRRSNHRVPGAPDRPTRHRPRRPHGRSPVVICGFLT